MKPWQAHSRQCGFTMVELVTVIAVLGILAVGTVRFISDSSSGFASTIARAELAGDTRFALERLSRNLRDALPNSVRTNGTCLEYVPVVSASTYLSLPVALAAGSFRAVPFDPPVAGGVRVAVFPDTGVYSLGTPAMISPPVTVSAPDAANEVTVTFASPHRFVTESPEKRVFLVLDPVSYCVDAGRLWRYQGYGFLALQAAPGGLPDARPERSLIAEQVATPAPFSLAGATLTRAAVVAIDVTFERGDDRIGIQHLVQVRNVP